MFKIERNKTKASPAKTEYLTWEEMAIIGAALQAWARDNPSRNKDQIEAVGEKISNVLL